MIRKENKEMYTYDFSSYWHKVKKGVPMTAEQKKQLEDFGWTKHSDLTYQGAECILQEFIAGYFS